MPLDEGRNIIVINLGTAYLKIEKRPAERELLLEILNERFKHSIGYDGTIQEWLGPSSYPGGMNVSRALHDENTRRQFRYHGCEILKLLCTGDYSEMIRMVGVIFHDAGIKEGSQVQRIDPHIQDKAIRRVSSEYLGRVRHIRPDGQKLFDVVNSFGKLSRNLLYERAQVGQGIKTSGEPRKDPFDLLSIYIDDLTKSMLSARKIWETLQKASIFIDIELAPSRDNPIADRATLRRIYCPAFKTTLTSSEHLVLSKDEFEYFIDKPQEFCANFYTRSPKKSLPLFKQEEDDDKEKGIEINSEDYEVGRLPEKDNRSEFINDAPTKWAETVKVLPDAVPIHNIIRRNSNYDLFIGAFGFEERTTGGIEMLAKMDVKVKNVVLFEFDRFFKEAERRRKKYEKCILKINSGNAHRPIGAPVLVQDLSLPEKMNNLLLSTIKKKVPKILFDCSSCPALILSQTLRLLINYPCELTLIYSEAKEYFPSKAESKEVRPRGKKVVPPFEGFTFVASPKILQSDDIGERPILLVLFPTFNTERTEGVLSQIEPSERIWIFGEPHDLSKNEYRIEMAQKFASPLIHSVDKWDLVSTFDYRKTMLSLGGIYRNYRFSFRTVIMPHGSKMQTLGVNLFALVHETALIFAMPKSYNPNRYSEGCLQVWAIELGNTNSLVRKLRVSRVIGN